MTSVNFCEMDYVYSNMIAEYYNTLSNIPMILLGYYGYYYHYKLHRQVNYRFIVLMIIGVGSFVFHTTMSRFGQLLDEIPMIWLNSFLLFDMFPSILLFIPPIIISILYGIFNYYSIFLIYIALTGSIVFLAPIVILKSPLSKKLITISLSLFTLGFIKWLLDFAFCPQLHDYYLHAWWHIWSGLSVYYYIQFQLSLRRSFVYPYSLLTVIKIIE